MSKFTQFLDEINALNVGTIDGMKELIALSQAISKDGVTREQREELFEIINDKIDHGFKVIREKRNKLDL